MSDDEQKADERGEPQKGPVLTDSKIPQAKNPAVFLIILAIVLGFGLVVGLYKRDTVIVETRPEAVVKQREVPQKRAKEESDLMGMPLMGAILKTSDTPSTVQEEPTCEFSPFIGQLYDEEVLKRIKDAANTERPYRILRPGEMYTQDFNPTRVNINLDESGQIAKIWCG